jgi:hypothetical protein
MLLRHNNVQMAVFWDFVPCCLVDTDRCFRGPYCLHRQIKCQGRITVILFRTEALLLTLLLYLPPPTDSSTVWANRQAKLKCANFKQFACDWGNKNNCAQSALVSFYIHGQCFGPSFTVHDRTFRFLQSLERLVGLHFTIVLPSTRQ